MGKDNDNKQWTCLAVLGEGQGDTLINPAPDFIWGLRPKVNQDGHQEH